MPALRSPRGTKAWPLMKGEGRGGGPPAKPFGFPLPKQPVSRRQPKQPLSRERKSPPPSVKIISGKSLSPPLLPETKPVGDNQLRASLFNRVLSLQARLNSAELSPGAHIQLLGKWTTEQASYPSIKHFSPPRTMPAIPSGPSPSSPSQGGVRVGNGERRGRGFSPARA